MVITVAALTASCAATPGPVRCQTYDAVALNPENHFAATVDGTGLSAIIQPTEGLDVSLALLQPLSGPVTLVHVVDEREAERWDLVLPKGNFHWVRCFVSPSPATSTCAATIETPPSTPSGYYYLLAHHNTVLDAGLSFRLCH